MKILKLKIMLIWKNLNLNNKIINALLIALIMPMKIKMIAMKIKIVMAILMIGIIQNLEKYLTYLLTLQSIP